MFEKYAKTPMIMITSEAAKYNVIEAINAGVTKNILKYRLSAENPLSEKTRKNWMKFLRSL